MRTLMIRHGVPPHVVAGHLRGGMAALKGLLDGTIAIDQPYAAALSELLGGTVSSG